MLNESFFHSSSINYSWSYLPLPLLSKKGALEGEYIMMINNQCKLRRFILIQNYLGCYTRKVLLQLIKGVIKWLNYENSLIELVSDKMMGAGILLTSGQKLILYGEVELWFNYMKTWSIQQGFFKTFKLIEKIGKGNQAEVYSCKYINGEGQFAVKLFLKHKIVDPIDKLALMKEIQILRQVQQENIIHLYEVFESDETIYVVMELFSGGDLSTYLKTYPPLSEKSTARFIYKLLKSISHINKFGVMHRDLKPTNIILRKRSLDQFCIADFGLAEYYNKDGKYLFVRCGTPGYVAPEVLRDEPYDFKVDIFSIGVIMYMLVMGEEPFKGDYEETITKNYTGEVDLSGAKISDQGLEFLKSLFEAKELRLSVTQAMNHQWFKQEKIVTAQYKIRVREPLLKVPVTYPSTKEFHTNSQLLKPPHQLMSNRVCNHRLSPIIKSCQNSPNPSRSPNPSGSQKRKSLK